jgi:KDO2-lipid IV(A) lauroyltransferase
MALYWALRLTIWVLGRVPLRVSYAIARVAGIATFYLWPGGRRRCIRNMLHVTGGDPARARTLARRSFGYYVGYLVDLLRFGTMSPGDVLKRVDFDDWSRIDEERAGHGIIMVTMHFGNWDFAGAAIAEHGVAISVVADTFAHSGTNDLIIGARERLGMHIIPADRMATGILRALRRDDVVALLIDIPQGQSGVQVEFFEGTVSVPDGPARLALRTGAVLMTGGIARLGPTSQRFDGMVKRVPFTASGDQEQDVRDLTQATMRQLEEMVRRYPDQWYIFRSLWLDDRAEEVA